MGMIELGVEEGNLIHVYSDAIQGFFETIREGQGFSRMEEIYDKLLDHIVDQSNSLDNEKVLKS
jgi:hypothetical protein